MKTISRGLWAGVFAVCCGCASSTGTAPDAAMQDAAPQDAAPQDVADVMAPDPAAVFGALEGMWDVTFTRSEFLPSTIEVHGATATATIWEDVPAREVAPGCVQRASGDEVVLTYQQELAQFDVTFARLMRVEGDGCAAVSLSTDGVVRGTRRPLFEVRRAGDAASLFGAAGGRWGVFDGAFALAFTIDARDGDFIAHVPSTHSGDVTLRAPLSGRMFTGTSTDGGEFVAVRR